MNGVLEYLKMGYEFIGFETVEASTPPTPTTIIVPPNIRKVVLVCLNEDPLKNLVFGAVADDDSVTAVFVPYCYNTVPVTIGPLDPASLPYHFYCTVPTDVRVAILGTEQGDLDAPSVR